MKPIAEWDVDYVLQLPAGEHDFVEFKSSRSLDLTLPAVNEGKVRRDLAKALSAFANTGSGVPSGAIVYGVANQAPGAVREIDEARGVSLGIRGGTKEWLEDVIPTLLDPLLMKFNVYTIQSAGNDSRLLPGRAMIVVEVPLSENAPHQARDECVYYGRVGGKSRPLSHQFVIDILNRVRHPVMDVRIQILREGIRSRPGQGLVLPTIDVRCANNGRVVAQNVVLFVDYPARLLEFSGGHERIGDDRVRAVYRNMYGKIPKSVPRFDPVLPLLGFHKTEDIADDLSDLDLTELSDERIDWIVYADAATPRSGSILVRDLTIVEPDET